jgi:NADH-quinone oxidoreductase subunit C
MTAAVTAELLAAAIGARFGDGAVSEIGEPTANTALTVTADVPPGRWLEALTFARDELGCDFFDWLSAVDELADGFAVLVHLYSLAGRHHVFVRTRVSRQAPHLATATAVYRGAAWHERETAEMFGVAFDGHPDPAPLLLPDGFDGHPLRKDFVLAARVAKPWPGGKEPGGAPARRRLRPPGVPPGWGHAAGSPARGDDATADDRRTGDR